MLAKAFFLVVVAVSAMNANSIREDPNCGPDGQGSGYFPDMKNCIKYYHCFEGSVEEHLTCGKSKISSIGSSS